MTLAELIEKRYELLKQKAEYESQQINKKAVMSELKREALVSGVGQDGKNAEIREALLDTYLMNNNEYAAMAMTYPAVASRLTLLQPEIAYIEDLIELAKLEMANEVR